MEKHDLGAVPWEPYKAATSASVKGIRPAFLPPLIKYKIAKHVPQLTPLKNIMSSDGAQKTVLEAVYMWRLLKRVSKQESFCVGIGDAKICDLSRIRPAGDGKESSANLNETKGQEKCDVGDVNEINKLKKDLELERHITEELKRLLVATMGDDLTCHVHSLTEDKIRLAHTMESFEKQVTRDHDRADNFAILADVWRCKFLAMSIQADELRVQQNRLLNYCKQMRILLEKFVDVNQSIFRGEPSSMILDSLIKKACEVMKVELSTFFKRSPCDGKVYHPDPLTSNITITCCKQCHNKEIKLI
ncbi:unnamed protein product [Thelazia callipaeda]|uniref:Golgin subfamily A member 4-like n=1 Tax=Thelazia callipaeda TaxID=103827 RepID=A0A0N5CS61_THECL|nr:unnamed protein product [Thelazia callipaeda]